MSPMAPLPDQNQHDLQAAVPPQLLRLPPRLRRRIYFWAGLAPLNCEGIPFPLDLHGDFDTPSLGFYGLLLSCRAIYTEASALLYSLNRFIIGMPSNGPYAMYRPPCTGLAPLRALTTSSLASLRHLTIIISEASCHPRKNGPHFGQCCDYVGSRLDLPPDGCRRHDDVTHDGPLQANDPFTETTLAEWQSTATFLSSRGISLANLELSFVCDVRCDEPQIAQLAVTPLASLAPLKDCHVRLCREHETEIQKIAENAVLCARGIPLRPSAISNPPETGRNVSPLLALPRELRFRILEYTDLITPWKEVTWDRLSTRYSAGWAGCYHSEVEGPGMAFASADHHGCQFSMCWEASLEPSVGCFCRLRHSASSSKCRCWGSPLALFLVSRALYEDAQVVFFSGNRFVVHDFDSFSPWRTPRSHPGAGYPMQRFAISIFLRDVVPYSCLSLLRFVEMVFPPYPYYSWPRTGTPALEDWTNNCKNWFKHGFNAPALTLRLYMVGTNRLYPPEDRIQMTKEQGHEIAKAYTRIFGPLSELGKRGLANFYGHFVWPWTLTRGTQRRIRERGDGRRWLSRKEAKLGERAERWVLGDRYDALYASREEPPESLWKLSFARHYQT